MHLEENLLRIYIGMASSHRMIWGEGGNELLLLIEDNQMERNSRGMSTAGMLQSYAGRGQRNWGFAIWQS